MDFPIKPPIIAREPMVLDFLHTRKKPNTIEDMPKRLLLRLAAKTYILMALAWDYIDTITDMAAVMRISELKGLCRTIKAIRRSYDQFRSRSINDASTKAEMERAVDFEEYCHEHLSKLFYSICNGISKFKLTDDYKSFLVGVYQALTVLDAVRLYGEYVDSRLKQHGIPTLHLTIIEDDFIKLFKLIPLFAGDCYIPDMECVRLTAKILVNKMHNVQLSDERGEL